MKRAVFGGFVALGLSAQLAAQQPVAVPAGSNDKVTLVGCVIKGDGGYVLSSPDNGWSATPGTPAASTVTSASSVAGRVFYWLNDDDDLNEHAGRKVEVAGKLADDIDKGKISVKRGDNGMMEIAFKAEGERKVTVKLPETAATVGTSGGDSDRNKDYRVVIRKIDVDSVKVLASACD